MEPTPRIFGIGLLAVAFGCAANGEVRADSNLRSELSVVARGIGALLKDLGQSEIEVRDFVFNSSDARIRSSAGPGIANVLTEELQKVDLRVRRGAPIEIRGSYDDVLDNKTGHLAARIRGEVLNSDGRVISTFNRGVFGDQALSSIFGTTANLPTRVPAGNNDPDATFRTERDKAIIAALDKPQVDLRGTRISVDSRTPYAIEVHVLEKGNFVARKPTVQDGQAFVRIFRNEEYAIKLINDSPHEAAVSLTIDGLSMFAFSDNKEYSQVIVPAKSAGIIKGWHRSNNVSDAFLVTDYSKSAVAMALPRPNSVGVVTASFSACFPKGGKPPDDEPQGTPKSTNFTEDATGRGRELNEKYTEVVRSFGVVRTTISVRYTK